MLVSIKKSYKFVLRPRKGQNDILEQCAEGTRVVYNYGLGRIKAAFEKKEPEPLEDTAETEKREGEQTTAKKKKIPTWVDLIKELTSLKKQEGYTWLADIPSQPLQQAMRDVSTSLKHFFRRIKDKSGPPGFPHFKKEGTRQTIRFPMGIKVIDDKVYLPTIGWLRFKKTQDLKGEIRQAIVKKDRGKWFISIMCSWDEDIQPVTDIKEIAHIELGTTSWIILNGEEIEMPHFQQQYLEKIKAFGRLLKKRTNGSRRWKKVKIGAIYRRITNLRKQFIDDLTSRIIKGYDAIELEKRDIKKEMQEGKSILGLENCWYAFCMKLKYKAVWAGKSLTEFKRTDS
jgi:putative transposase